jgi:hypothetical protein
MFTDIKVAGWTSAGLPVQRPEHSRQAAKVLRCSAEVAVKQDLPSQVPPYGLPSFILHNLAEVGIDFLPKPAAR